MSRLSHWCPLFWFWKVQNYFDLHLWHPLNAIKSCVMHFIQMPSILQIFISQYPPQIPVLVSLSFPKFSRHVQKIFPGAHLESLFVPDKLSLTSHFVCSIILIIQQGGIPSRIHFCQGGRGNGRGSVPGAIGVSVRCVLMVQMALSAEIPRAKIICT